MLPPIFQHPTVAKLNVGPENVFEGARGPLSPCQVPQGLDFTHCLGPKTVEFYITTRKHINLDMAKFGTLEQTPNGKCNDSAPHVSAPSFESDNGT